MNKHYDYLIVGTGLFGSICARELTNKGYKCIVIDKRSHIGGNCYTENINGINVHKYGPHIFHTSNKNIWNYINKFATFNNYIHVPKVFYKNNLYSFPINLMTLYQVFGIKTPEEAYKKLEEVKIKIENPKNLEEYILSQVGEKLYRIFIEGYTKKQWNINPQELPSFIIKRIPIRTTFNDNYFDDIYQGIPIGGYTQIFERLLENIEVELNTDYFSNRKHFDTIASKIIYTGPIDKFYDYQFGELTYRSLRFETEIHNVKDYQGVAVMNYTDINIPYTRIIEHKHFEFGLQPTTVITKEYSQNYNHKNEPYYPINNEVNNQIYNKYKLLTMNDKNVIFGGRLAEYKYYDMHQVIGSALSFVKNKI